MSPATFDRRDPTEAQRTHMSKMAGYPFRWSDGGRSMSSRRPKQSNDCTVRAIALVTGLAEVPGLGYGITGAHYDAVDQLLAADAGRRYGAGVFLARWLHGRMEPALDEVRPVFGYMARRVGFPARQGQRRMNPVTFAKHFTKGRWVVFTAKHVYAVIDGVAYDTEPAPVDRCIYQAWEFTLEGVR